MSVKKKFALCQLVEELNRCWAEAGQTSKIVIKNKHIQITEKEVIIVVPVKCEIRIPAESFNTIFIGTGTPP